MSKHKNVPAVTEAAKQAGRQLELSGKSGQLPGLAGRRVAALMTQGDEIAAKLNGGHQRSLKAVCADGVPFSALIRHGNTVVQIEGDSFAVSTHD